MTFEKLRKAVTVKTPLAIGSLFGDCFSLFQKVWLQGLLLQALTILVLYGLVIIVYIPIMGSLFVMDDPSTYGEGDELNFLTVVIFVLYFLVYLSVAVFQVGLMAAFYRIMRLKDRGVNSEKGINFGMFFKKKYFLKLILIGLLNLVLIAIATLLFIVPVFFVIIPIQFVILFFAFHPDLSLKEIYTLSFSLGLHKWGTTFVVFGGMFLFSLLGMVLCFFGILATASIVLIPAYLVYKEVIGFNEVEDAIESIGGV
jgi:hypothetical protein